MTHRYWFKSQWSVGSGNDIAPITPDELKQVAGHSPSHDKKSLPGAIVYYIGSPPSSDDCVERDIIAYLLKKVFRVDIPESTVCTEATSRELAGRTNARWCIGIRRTSYFDQRRVTLRLLRVSDPTAIDKIWERSFSLSDRDATAVFQIVRRHLADLLKGASPKLEKAAKSVRRCDLRMGLQEDFARDSRSRKAIVEALWAIEESIVADQEDRRPIVSLDRAEYHLARSFQFEPNNPFAHFLLAHCYFNRLQALPPGDREEVMYRYKYGASLRAAHDCSKSRKPGDPIRQEIAAEYALMIDRDHHAAFKMYEKLASNPACHSSSRLRAHWMLAGMYLGDWDVGRWSPDLVDTTKARGHILQILARWPGSPQARYYLPCCTEITCSQVNIASTQARHDRPYIIDESGTRAIIPLHRHQFTGWLSTN